MSHSVTFHCRLMHVEYITTDDHQLHCKLYVMDTSLAEPNKKDMWPYHTATVALTATLPHHLKFIRTFLQRNKDMIIR
jgi:hypothetical protein